ncbi:MAG: hypothetical protein ABIH36_01170 [bacterium]
MFSPSLETIKRNKWNTAVIVASLMLLLSGTLHSINFSAHGALLFIVSSLVMLVFLMNFTNLVLLLVHVYRHGWSIFLTTLAVMIISSLLWVLTMIIDPISLIV